jgi:bacterial/archaeal transporter family-2 protein
MTTKLLFAALAVCAGIAGSFQSAANAGLAQKAGLGAALVANTTIVMAGSLAVFFARAPHAGFHPVETPWSLYIGGFCGFVIILSLAFVFPKIGAALAMALVVLGQSGAALAIDHYGLMGMPKDPVSVSRVAGFALVAAGVALIRL